VTLEICSSARLSERGPHPVLKAEQELDSGKLPLQGSVCMDRGWHQTCADGETILVSRSVAVTNHDRLTGSLRARQSI
jgi:hypothetical protein